MIAGGLHVTNPSICITIYMYQTLNIPPIPLLYKSDKLEYNTINNRHSTIVPSVVVSR